MSENSKIRWLAILFIAWCIFSVLVWDKGDVLTALFIGLAVFVVLFIVIVIK